MKWTALWLSLNLACVARALTEPMLSPWILLNAFVAGLLAVVLVYEWLEAE